MGDLRSLSEWASGILQAVSGYSRRGILKFSSHSPGFHYAVSLEFSGFLRLVCRFPKIVSEQSQSSKTLQFIKGKSRKSQWCLQIMSGRNLLCILGAISRRSLGIHKALSRKCTGFELSARSLSSFSKRSKWNPVFLTLQRGLFSPKRIFQEFPNLFHKIKFFFPTI